MERRADASREATRDLSGRKPGGSIGVETPQQPMPWQTAIHFAGGYRSDRWVQRGDVGGYRSDRWKRRGDVGGYCSDRRKRRGDVGGYRSDRWMQRGGVGGYRSDRWSQRSHVGGFPGVAVGRAMPGG